MEDITHGFRRPCVLDIKVRTPPSSFSSLLGGYGAEWVQLTRDGAIPLIYFKFTFRLFIISLCQATKGIKASFPHAPPVSFDRFAVFDGFVARVGREMEAYERPD
jgi:hypothetical protein